MLGLILGRVPRVKGKTVYFPELLEAAAPAARPRLTKPLVHDLLVMHSVRNGFIHEGQSVAVGELDRAIACGHALARHVRLPGRDRLVGAATVVADIIQFEIVGMYLRVADDLHRKNALRLAADATARGFDEAMFHTEPLVRNLNWGRQRSGLRYDGPEGAIRDVARGIGELSELVIPQSIGTSAQSYAFVRSVIGEAEHDGGPVLRVDRPTDGPPDAGELRTAMLMVSEIIFRLWALGALVPEDEDVHQVRGAANYLADPAGWDAMQRAPNGTSAGREGLPIPVEPSKKP